jgi:hypothetical protein
MVSPIFHLFRVQTQPEFSSESAKQVAKQTELGKLFIRQAGFVEFD